MRWTHFHSRRTCSLNKFLLPSRAASSKPKIPQRLRPPPPPRPYTVNRCLELSECHCHPRCTQCDHLYHAPDHTAHTHAQSTHNNSRLSQLLADT